MKIVFCGGGTGGHVYPALTVAAALRRLCGEGQPLQLLYLGVRGKIDAELVRREGIDFQAITAGPLRVGSPLGTATGGLKLAVGSIEAWSLLRRFRPDAVCATGGYGSVGVGLAARVLRRPLLLFLPDVEAGLAVKTLVRLADRIAVTVPPALAAMPAAKTVLTGYPVRPAFFAVQRDQSRVRLGLHPSLPTLLVMGGSTGASALNRALAGWSADFLRLGQLLHVCGQNDVAWLQQQRAALSPEAQERYHLHAYLHDDVAEALAAADLAVMRAGASTLGELPATRLPAILVPGEFSDQADNAAYLEKAGAAVTLPQSRLVELQGLVMALLADGERRDRMREALAGLARPDAAERLAGQLASLAGSRLGVAA